MSNTAVPKRKWHKTKAEWAEAKVQELEALLVDMRSHYVPSANWRGVRSKRAGIVNIEAELAKYRALVQRFRSRGE